MTIRILIVDDEFGLADIVAEILSERGYEVAIAINGKLGLEELARQPVSLILLDVMMPVMDGAAMVRLLRQDERYRELPVVMMTALREALPTDEPPLYQAVLFKPFTEEKLMREIDRLLAGA
jgi:CheY-like chemotaxis protein